jgi:hypothetical protein
MSLQIHRFVDLVKATESRGQSHLQMSLRDAKDLHADITKLLVTLEQLRNNTSSASAPTSLELSGGDFKNS